MSKKTLTTVIAVLGLCVFASVRANEAIDERRPSWRSMPETCELVNMPYLLLRINPNEAEAWVKGELAGMIVTGGNVLDNPQGFPHGYHTIAYRDGGGLAFLVEKGNEWVKKDDFQPNRKEPFYLCLWQTGWAHRDNR